MNSLATKILQESALTTTNLVYGKNTTKENNNSDISQRASTETSFFDHSFSTL